MKKILNGSDLKPNELCLVRRSRFREVHSVLTAGAIRVVCFRKNGQDRRGDGSNKQRHEGSREELDRDGKMLWNLCVAV